MNQDSKKEKDTYSYKGWLISDSFLKRAFAVLGYSTVSSFIVYLAVIAVVFVIGGLAELITS